MIIAIVRNNLAVLFSNHSSLVCKSSVSFSLSPHFFSTLRETQRVICPRIYDLLLDKYHFPHELASQVASDLSRSKSPKNADSVLSFLKESGCSSTQLQKMVAGRPQILSQGVEGIKLKIKVFQDLGLSPEDIAKLVSRNQVILTLSAKSRIVPSISVLNGLLGSDYYVARLLRRSAWSLCTNLKKTLMPNVELLKNFGIPIEHVTFFLFSFPRFLLINPDTMRKSIDKAKDLGFSPSSKTCIYAVRIIALLRKGKWEAKLQSFRDMGFSDSDTLVMFKRFPNVFCVSIKKIEKLKQLLLATGNFDISSIVGGPSSLGCSIVNRIEPRLRILGILESKNLIKWPSFSTIYTLTDDQFVEKFVKPYQNEVGKLVVTKSCIKELK